MPIALRPDDWPGFRGPQRDGTVRGLNIITDWNAHPPKLLWRQPVGPGWSSPVVVGGRVFTQEQLGANEVITCRALDNGSVIWSHTDPARFEESMGGPGPRATPQFADGKLYTFGATGVLNCLDASSGQSIWLQNVATQTGVAPPMWGFASSPLVMRGIVIVYVGGAKGLLGYHADTGLPAWSINSGLQSYISAQPAVLDGREQVLFMSDMALFGADPASGKLLWNHDVPSPQMWRAIQPHVISPTQVVVSSESDLGTALVEISHAGDAWSAQRKWVSRALKPSFNDFVVQDGYAYGFDGQIFSCTDLKTGKRTWREGNYGHGQVVLLADQKLLLIISEEGELVLLKATPDRHEELTRAPAIAGKTWNHPAIAGAKLVVRNGQEMACFDLPTIP
jgi:outer membrane protein assembly factor BamB